MLKRLQAFLLLALVSLPAQADPLSGGRGLPSEGGGLWMPEAARPLLAWLAVAQRHAVSGLREQIDAIQDGAGIAPVLTLMLIGFVYGIVHAAGPGHGKMVVGGYFLTQRARLVEGVILSAGMAFVQALTAILLVAVFTFAVTSGTASLMDGAAYLEAFSYGLIALLGLGLAWASFKGKSCCHGGPDHVHGPECRHNSQPKPPLKRKELLAASLAVGLRPCTGAVMILLFTFANQIAWAGILATLAMAVGTMITVSAVSLGAIGVQSVFARMGAREGTAALIRRGIGVAGGLLIALAGLAMLAASLSLAAG